MIVGVAIRQKGRMFSMREPARHGNIIRMVAEGGFETPVTGEQGFIDEYGHFLDRQQAVIHARHCHQIGNIKRTQPQDTLFSEDLW